MCGKTQKTERERKIQRINKNFLSLGLTYFTMRCGIEYGMLCLVIFFKQKNSVDCLSSLAELKVHQVKLDVDICKYYT